MKNYIEKSMTFAEYIGLIDGLLLEGKTTGENQSEAMFGYGKLNRQRMKRLENTVVLNKSLKEKARGIQAKLIWLIITEGWCGDAAQNIPVVEKIAAESQNIETRYVLRDENLELMDKYLTNGGRAIPKLICLDAQTFEEIGTWGSRPAPADDYLHELKAQGLEKPEMMEKLQRWYLSDNNKAIQKEFENLIVVWAEISGNLIAAKN